MSSASFVWPHLSALPAFRALIRAIEHKLLSEYLPLKGPVLDVGAGDGHFAAVALANQLDAGIDVSLTSLAEARRRGTHRLLVCSSATEMPFPSTCFETVVSNCVVEHIQNLSATLKEMYRVTKPGGTLLLTVPTDRLEPNLLLPAIMRRIGLSALARAYVSRFRRAQVHYHLKSRPDWLEAVEAVGFSVVRSRGYMSAPATRVFEIGHYAGVPNLISRRVTGKWVFWPWRPRFFLLERLLAHFVEEAEHEDDSCLFIEARKPARP